MALAVCWPPAKAELWHFKPGEMPGSFPPSLHTPVLRALQARLSVGTDTKSEVDASPDPLSL